MEKQLPRVRATGTPKRADGGDAKIARRGDRGATTDDRAAQGRDRRHPHALQRGRPRVHARLVRRARRLGPGNRLNWEMSVPETNAPPAPVRTSARTARSASTSRATSAIRSYIANVIALRAWGRLKVSHTTSPAALDQHLIHAAATVPLATNAAHLVLGVTELAQHLGAVLAQARTGALETRR